MKTKFENVISMRNWYRKEVKLTTDLSRRDVLADRLLEAGAAVRYLNHYAI